MSSIQYSVKHSFCKSIDISIDRARSTAANNTALLEISFGGAIADDVDKTSFMVSSELVWGSKNDGFYCKIDQRTIFDCDERPTEQIVNDCIVKERGLLYQLLRQKAVMLLAGEEEMDCLPAFLDETELV